MAFTEDLSVFFNEDEFAVSATLDGASVTGIFDAAYANPLDVGGTAPIFRLPTASVPASPNGKVLVIGAASYTVREHQPDGTGVSILVLESA